MQSLDKSYTIRIVGQMAYVIHDDQMGEEALGLDFYFVPAEPSPAIPASISLSPRPGWTWYESLQFGYRIAYSQVWNVYPDKYREGQTIFQSPETGAEVQVFIRTLPPDADWLDWVRENWQRVFMHDVDPGSITYNSRFLGREAVFLFEPAHDGTGDSATLLFGDGERLFALYLHGGAEPPLEAEAAVYRYMLTTFSLTGGGSSNGFTVPTGAWDQIYATPGEITGTVLGSAPEQSVIILSEPAMGFVSVTLSPGGRLLDGDGQAASWDAIVPGMSIRAYGTAGEAGTYQASRITLSAVLTPPTESTCDLEIPGFQFEVGDYCPNETVLNPTLCL